MTDQEAEAAFIRYYVAVTTTRHGAVGGLASGAGRAGVGHPGQNLPARLAPRRSG